MITDFILPTLFSRAIVQLNTKQLKQQHLCFSRIQEKNVSGNYEFQKLQFKENYIPQTKFNRFFFTV